MSELRVSNLVAPDGSPTAKVNGVERPEVPPGAVMFFAATTPPPGFLKANGATISRTAYASLFAAIGTQFGAGDGSTTFALPDMRGYAPRGWDDGRGVDTGRVFGSEQSDGIKQSTAPFRSDSNGNSKWAGAAVGAFSGEFSAGGATAGTSTTETANGTVQTFKLLQLGSAPETRMKNIALLACIKF